MDVEDAVRAEDLDRLKELSLRVGGFGDERTVAWPFLLGVTTASSPGSRPTEDPHKDESQVKLDTDRSFVLYPNVRDIEKEKLKARLNELIVGLLRKRRKLSYVQGYHDVISVLMLTLTPNDDPSPEEKELLFACAEKMSLFRLRDAMGPGLEPLLGLLRIVRRLLRLADRPYAAIIEKTAPLPYFALSNLLTLFSHDVQSLPIIQHIFDFLLCWEPIMAVYLAAALILKRKPDVMARIAEDGDEGAMYVLLGSMPTFLDADPADDDVEHSTVVISKNEELDSLNEKGSADDASPSPTSEPPPYSAIDEPESPPIPLVSLLQQALTLHTLYPPSTPALRLNSTLGPLSVHRPSPIEATDSDAESFVERHAEVILSLEDEDEELRANEAELAKRRDMERRTLMAVAVVGAGVLLAIYGAEGGFGRVDWREVGRVMGDVAKVAGARLARGG